MATESPIRMSETSGKWASHKRASTFAQSSAGMAAEELKLLLKGHRFTGSGKDVAPSRSGSAPPSIEGSFLSVNNIFSQQNSQISENMASHNIDIGNYESEEQLRADPAYFSYYCSNVNLNPRLPPPLISWENQRLVRHIGSFGKNWGLTSVDDSGDVSFHLSQGSLPTHKEEPEDDHSPQQPSNSGFDRAGEMWSGQDTTSLVDQHKIAGNLLQDDFRDSSSPEYVSSRGITVVSSDCEAGSSSLYDSPIKTHNVNASNLASDDATDTDRSLGPAPSSSSVDSTRSIGGDESGVNIMGSEMKALSISNFPTSSNQVNQEQWQQSCQNNLRPPKIKLQNNLCLPQSTKSQITTQGFNCTDNSVDQNFRSPCKFSAEVQPVLQSSGFTPPLYASAAAYMTSTNPFYSNLQAPGFFNAQFVGGYAVNPNAFPAYVSGYPPGPVPLVVDGTAGPSFNTRTTGVPSPGAFPPGADVPNLNKFYGQIGFPVQPSFVDPMYMQYHQQPFGEPYGIAGGPFDPLAARAGVVGGQVNTPDLKNGLDNAVYMDEHKIQHQRGASHANLIPRRGGPMSPNYFGNTSNVGVLMHYPTSPLASPVLSGSPGGGAGLPRGRAEMRFSPGAGRNAGMYSGWPGQRGFEIFDDPKMYNFLEELKSGKGRRFELSDITGHIVEFSSDQHGSRFIQQKLENCTVEEKASVFKEVLPHASKLMTDVFGNYVIQKFFEYGSHDQRKDLANQLTGQILPLSLQMYGCRVIQKALEVVELEQKAQLVRELDGHVMRCVRDQNGNHVIQKCIESIPTEKIGYIISAFRGQVATLSMHPYGCRVIQRVLEHCTDELQCQFIVDEILESVCALAQDQYGNYVTQHVLDGGKAHERSLIIGKLSGHVVHLSQHKFASNVIEKCLEHGGPADRELLINEVLGHNEGNDNLLTMMKDQYANYVVQKSLEICTDSQRIVLLNRIRSHAHALKKYTYGKHIVARFEQVFGEENQTSAT